MNRVLVSGGSIYNSAMSRYACLAGFVAFALSAHASPNVDQFTPVLAATLTPNTRPFHGTDGKTHVDYELVLTNANPAPATLQKIEVVDASNPSSVLASYEGRELLSHLRTTAATPAESLVIEFNNTRIFLVDLTVDPAAKVPNRMLHTLHVLGASRPARQATPPVPLSYTVAPLEILQKLPQIGPPLAGNGWVALNGCCDLTGVHRSSSLACNGSLYLAQRFAIDWMRLDRAGHFFEGDAADVHSYSAYDADVLAVADGKVVETLDTQEDQKPGSLPDPSTITLQNVDGNHIVIDLGDGVFAFYAHLVPRSLKVAVGDRVKRGQLLAKLGNTGNTSAPHLHFHLMEGTSVLCSNGIPYSFDAFALAGQISVEDFAKATGVEGDWGKGLFPVPRPRQSQYPLDLNIVDFPASK